jgi:hypothetical protein
MFLLNLTLLATAFLRCATAQLPALEDPGQDLASYVSVSEQIRFLWTTDACPVR